MKENAQLKKNSSKITKIYFKSELESSVWYFMDQKTSQNNQS